MGKDIFRVRIKRIDKPSENLFYTSNMPVLPNDGDCLYVEEKSGLNRKYVVEKKDWAVTDLDGNNFCLVVIWVRDPDLSK